VEIFLPNTEKWHALNEEIHGLLGLSSETSVRTYRGIHHAAFEIVQGTSSFLSHKRAMGWLKGQTFAYASVLPYLYKEAFQVQPLSLKNPNMEISAWVESLKKDTSFVIMNEDHPVTGELFDTDLVDQLLNDKKIISIRVSHGKHWLRGLPVVRPYSVLICQVSEDLAVAVVGSKFKSPVQMAAHFIFDREKVISRFQEKLSQRDESIEDILKFESSLKEGFQILERGSNFLVDRALIFHPEVNAEALAHELSALCSLRAGAQLLPLNGCAQNFVDWEWWEGRPESAVLRGLLLVDLTGARLLANSSLLLEALTRCLV
jgi:hypothetical protein